VTSKERVRALPEVRSLSETPALAAYELNNSFHAGAATKAHRGRRHSLARRTEEFRALIVADSLTFARIIKDVGIPMEG